jgi:hypothetical protein
MAAFARLLRADIELHRSIDPEDERLLWALIAIGLLRLTLKVIGDVTTFWKSWSRV